MRRPRAVLENTLKRTVIHLAAVPIFLGACSPALEDGLVGFTSVAFLSGLTHDVLRAAAIGAGALLLVLGWRIYRWVIALPGFLLGAILAVSLIQFLELGKLYEWVGLAIGGGLGAWMALVVHDVAVFLVGGFGGTFLAYSLWGLLAERDPPVWALVAVGILFGVLLLSMVDARRILVSAAIGATMVGWGLKASLLIMVALALSGLILQTNLSRRLRMQASP